MMIGALMTHVPPSRTPPPAVALRGQLRISHALAVIALGACGEAGDPPVVGPPDVTDTNPAPEVLEVELVAGLGKATLLTGAMPADVWAYRDGARPGATGTVPGPVLQARVGDRVIVHLRNELPEPTTIHWHGIRVPASSDGTPAVQTPVPPGGTFTYEFVAEDAGTFWYHPHVRSDVQIERGLYGMMVVNGGPDVAVDADRAFVLDDVKLEADGRLSARTDALDIMLGRQGNVLLVNGRQRPTIAVKSGGRERWRFVNAANGRYFNLKLPGHSFTVIGWDAGLLARPYETETLLITPGERYEVLVTPKGPPGGTLALQTIHHDRGHDIPDPGPIEILKISLKESAGDSGPLPASWGGAVDLVVPQGAVERALVLSEEEKPGVEPRFLINGGVFPDVAPLSAREGDVEVWSIRNDAEMDHPFHLHGMFFTVLDVDGVPPAQAGWKDTVNVPRKKTLRFAVRYGRPGTWMFHCHILEHAERGMMGELVLMPRN
jgi:FtsP/CotA-like multicopper oxidase with cupredoxin domain